MTGGGCHCLVCDHCRRYHVHGWCLLCFRHCGIWL